MQKETVNPLLNKVVQVGRGGPECKVGMVMATGDDYFTLLTEDDGIVYYKTQHTKSITQNAKNELTLDVEIPEDFEYVTGSDFKSVLSGLQDEWVQINRGGPESIEGVLQDITDDFAVLIADEEVVRISLYHVKNISYGLKIEKEENEEKEEKENKKQNSSQQDQEK